jgi:hypothetical protein
MKTTVTDYISVREKLLLLGYRSPDAFALLPANLEIATTASEVRQRSESATVRTLFRQGGVPIEDVYDKANRPPYIQNNDISWIAPTIFVAAGALSANPNLISVALGVLSNYLTDLFKGRTGEPVVRATIIVEQTRSKTCKRVEYEGSVAGLQALAAVVASTQNDDNTP